MVVKLVAEVVKVRVSCGEGRRMRRVGYLHPSMGSQLSGEVKTRMTWSRLWKEAELEKYMSEE